ncbi:uncharacterized protein METZ01_LOCUS138034, partial [marine metagenome]
TRALLHAKEAIFQTDLPAHASPSTKGAL